MALTPATNRQVPGESILNHFGQQVYLGNQFIVTIPSVTVTVSETNLIYINNPGVQTGISKSLFVNISKMTCLTALGSTIMRIYLNPTVTSNGTPITPVNARPGNTNTSVSLVYSGPSASSDGKLVDILGAAALVVSQSDQLIILDPGQTMLVTGQGSGTVSMSPLIGFYEI